MALISPDDDQFDILLHKLKERMDEGHGETIYEIGVGGEEPLCPNVVCESLTYILSSLALFHLNTKIICPNN